MLKKQIIVFAICTLISMALIALSPYSAATMLVMPLVFNMLYSIETVHCNGYLVALTASMNLALCLPITKDLFTTFAMLPLIVVSGIIVGLSAIKKWGKMAAISGAMLATGGVYVAYILYSIKFLDINPVMEMFSLMEKVMTMVVNSSDMKADVTFIREYLALSKNLFVAIMIITFSFSGYFVAFMSAEILAIFKGDKQLNLTLSEFKTDSITLFIYLISLIAVMFMKEGIVSVTLTNIYVLIHSYLVVCGVSIVYYLLKHKVKAPVIVKRLIGVVLLMAALVGLLSFVFVIAAMLDARRDFRGLNKFEE